MQTHTCFQRVISLTKRKQRVCYTHYTHKKINNHFEFTQVLYRRVSVSLHQICMCMRVYCKRSPKRNNHNNNKRKQKQKKKLHFVARGTKNRFYLTLASQCCAAAV